MKEGQPASLPHFPHQEMQPHRLQGGKGNATFQALSSLPRAAGSLPHSASASPILSLTGPMCQPREAEGHIFQLWEWHLFLVEFAFLPPPTGWLLSSPPWLRLFSSRCFLTKASLAGVHGYGMPAQGPSGSALGVTRSQYTGVESPRKVGSSTGICLFVHLSI